MTSNILRPAVISCAVVLLPFIPFADVQAHELNTIIGLDYTYSDNPLILPTPLEVEDQWAEPHLRIDYLLEYTSFEANLEYDVRRVEYKDDTFPSRTDLLGQGSFLWTISNERLFWNFYQNRNRVTLNSIDRETPDNQTERNVIQTGPTAQFRLGSSGMFRVSGSYIDTSFDEGSLIETEQARVTTDLTQSVGANSTAGITATWSDVTSDFDTLEYESQRVGLTLVGSGRQFTYNITIGQNSVERESGSEFDGLFYAISWSLPQTGARWRLSANRELTDSNVGLSLSNTINNPLDNGDTDVGVQDIIERTRYEAGVEFDITPERSSIELSAYHDDSDFKTQPRDTVVSGARFDFRYSFSPRTTLRYSYDWSIEEFELDPVSLIADEYEDTDNRLELIYTPNQRLVFTLWGANYQRKYETTDLDLEENSGGITIEYRI